MLLKEIFNKYSDFNLTQEDIESIIKKLELTDEKESIKKISIYLDSIIVKDEKNRDLLYAKYKYLIKLFKIQNKEKSTEDIYNDAFNYVLNNYNDKVLFSQNILDYVKKKDKITSDTVIDKNRTYSVIILKQYIKANNISIHNLSLKIGISEIKMFDAIYRNEELKSHEIRKVLEFFKVKTYEELCEMFYKNYGSLVNKSTYNINFLKTYMKQNNIDKKELANALNIDEKMLDNYLDGKRTLESKYYNDLCKFFNVNNIKELTKLNKGISHDITYILKYLNNKGISIKDFSANSGIDEKVLIYVKTGLKIDNNEFNKILKYFEVDSEHKLKEKIKKLNNEYLSSFDFELFEKYIYIYSVSYAKLSEKLNINSTTFKAYLVRKSNPPKTFFEDLMKIYKKDSIYELNLYFQNKIEEYNYSKQKMDKLVDLIVEYIEKNNIRNYVFSNEVGIALSTLNELKDRTKELNMYYLNKLIKAFEVNDIDELIDLLERNEQNTVFIKYNLLFIREYLDNMDLSLQELAGIMDISPSTLLKSLNGVGQISAKTLKPLFDYFRVKDFDEFKEYIFNNYEYGVLYDIRFLKDYLKTNKITQSEFAKIICVPTSHAHAYLNGNVKMPGKYIPDLFDYFNVNSIEELKALVKEDELNIRINAEKNIPNDKVDISFLKPYLIKKRITQESFAHELNISSVQLNRYLNGTYYYPLEKINILFEYFGVSSLEELKKLSKHVLENINESTISIKFLKPYLKYINMSILSFSSKLKISNTMASYYLNGITFFPESKVQDLLIIFNVTTLDELEKIVKIELELDNNKQKILNKYDISFLKDYLKYKNISIENLARRINIDKNLLSKYLNGTDYMTYDVLYNILAYFDVKNYDELLRLVKFEIGNIKLSSNYDISFLNYYVRNKNISYSDLANSLNISETSMRSYLYGKKMPYKYLDSLLKYFNTSDLDKLKENVDSELKYSNIVISNLQYEINESLLYNIYPHFNNDEANIINLLFNNNKKNIVSIYDASRKLKISEIEILRVYLYCVKMFHQYLNNSYKLKLEN